MPLFFLKSASNKTHCQWLPLYSLSNFFLSLYSSPHSSGSNSPCSCSLGLLWTFFPCLDYSSLPKVWVFLFIFVSKTVPLRVKRTKKCCTMSKAWRQQNIKLIHPSAPEGLDWTGCISCVDKTVLFRFPAEERSRTEAICNHFTWTNGPLCYKCCWSATNTPYHLCTWFKDLLLSLLQYIFLLLL